MFRAVADFQKTWQSETESTLRVMKAMREDALDQAVAPGHRTLRRLAFHLAATIPEMMRRTGLSLEGPGESEGVPDRIDEIVGAYELSARSLSSEVAKRWDDASLLVEDEMYGETWARGFTLLALTLHQAHHRGQMTVLMRQAGLAVPGVYGPALEEWGAFGMPAPAI